MTTNVRILREDPNSISKSSQFVSHSTVSTETAAIYEDYRRGRINLNEALGRIDVLSLSARTSVPFSVYLNVHATHASVFFIQTDLVNRIGENVEESKKLAQMEYGLRVFFCDNSFQIVNAVRIRRVDLFTDDGGSKYKIGLNGDVMKPGIYKMFKCYETIGLSDYDIEWSLLMAAQDWYDTASNNCLSFSKRIVRELHKHMMGEEISNDEVKKLNKLYISVPGEASFEHLRSRVGFFLAPSIQPIALIVCLCIFVAVYVEIRMRYF